MMVFFFDFFLGNLVAWCLCGLISLLSAYATKAQRH